MGGGSLPSPATTAGNHHSQPLYSQPIPHFHSNLSTKTSNFTNESKQTRAINPIIYPNQPNFGPVPSKSEVQNAITDLQRAMNGVCAANSGIEEFGGRKRFLDAYNLLQTDPLVQRLVVSISSDAEVWDAILKNDAVRELQGSLPLTEEEGIGYKQEPNSMYLIVKWIFAVLKSKIIEFVEKLEVLVYKKLHFESKNTRSTSKNDDVLEEKVRSSLLLSIVVLVIVFVTRSMET